MTILPGARMVWALGLAAIASPAVAADDPPLSPLTAESGADLDAVRSAMELPHLSLAIRVDPAAQSIAARADYTVRALSPLERVEFDLDPRFEISGVNVDGAPLDRSGWSNPEGLLAIALPAPLDAGETVAVSISYDGKPRVAPRAPWDGGFVWSKTENGEPWIATAVQSEGCDLFWPCLDHPSKRVELLDLAVTVPEPLVVASNGRLVGEDSSDGTRTYRWRARWPNNYGVSLQIGPYDLVTDTYQSRYGNAIPVQFWYLPGHEEGARRLVSEMHDALDFFESTIGPYPFGDEKVGLAETPHLGMEHQTINAYGEGYKLAPEGFDWLMQHEFSHEWFANQLSNAENADMWLQEGFGTYMQPLFLRWAQGETAYRIRMWDLRKKIVSRVPLAPRGFVSSAYYDDAEAGWGGDIYYKGAWVLHTLRGLIGDEAFFTATRKLTYGRDDPAPGNFTPIRRSTDDFLRIVNEVTGKDYSWFFETYFRTASLPTLVASREGSTVNLAWETEASLPFEAPVEVEIGGEKRTVAMPGGKGRFPLADPGSHYVLDPDTRILRYDPAITAWQKQEAERKAEASK